MNDCPNAEMRDRLPDLLHERLDVSVRSTVLAHIADCVDCRDELELLRGVHRALVLQTPRIDVSYVVAALPKPTPNVIPLRAASRRSRRMDWRVAAAVTLLAAGSGSFALLNRQPSAGSWTNVVGVVTPAPSAAPVVAPDAPVPADSGPTTVAAITSSAQPAAGESQSAAADAASDARLGDLNEQQLKSLLDDIQGLKAVPLTEPDPVAIRVNAATSGVEES